jgi:hypothetical protein
MTALSVLDGVTISFVILSLEHDLLGASLRVVIILAFIKSLFDVFSCYITYFLECQILEVFQRCVVNVVISLARRTTDGSG